jgi:hypothetical protein
MRAGASHWALGQYAAPVHYLQPGGWAQGGQVNKKNDYHLKKI